MVVSDKHYLKPARPWLGYNTQTPFEELRKRSYNKNAVKSRQHDTYDRYRTTSYGPRIDLSKGGYTATLD